MTASEIQLQYFASKDLDVTRTLTRNFVWTANSLWRDEVEHRTSGDGIRRLKTTVVIGGRDIITNTIHLGRYLQREEKMGVKWYEEEEPADDTWMERNWTGHKSLEVLWLPDLNHAESFDDEVHRQIILDIMKLYT